VRAEEGIEVIHVLISYRGARRAPTDVERTRDQAHRLAKHLLLRARAHEPLAEIAASWSDEPYGRHHDGFVTLPRDGTFLPFASAYDLDLDAFSDVVESEYGFHLLQRVG